MSSNNTGDINSDTSVADNEAVADAGGPVPRPGLRLWPHQDEAATATTKLLAKQGEALLVLAEVGVATRLLLKRQCGDLGVDPGGRTARGCGELYDGG